jgi:hypothetical protein
LGILHEGSFWNDLFLPFETLDKELKSYLDTSPFLLEDIWELIGNGMIHILRLLQQETQLKLRHQGGKLEIR